MHVRGNAPEVFIGRRRYSGNGFGVVGNRVGLEFFHHSEFFKDVLSLFDQCGVPFCMYDVGFEQLPASLFFIRLQ
ncbi:MAG: Uncharacterised protein [Flavobacteriia bacterium]|nr:MAG: Uncharacterised protein [Flavobacteriia bacterium]